MGRRCPTCEHRSFSGGPDPLSDICDGCQDDPNTGWFGTTDHSIDPDEEDEDDDEI